MTVKTRLERVEKEAKKREPQEEYTVTFERDGFVMVCWRGSKEVGRFEAGNINYRDDI